MDALRHDVLSELDSGGWRLGPVAHRIKQRLFTAEAVLHQSEAAVPPNTKSFASSAVQVCRWLFIGEVCLLARQVLMFWCSALIILLLPALQHACNAAWLMVVAV